MTLKFKWAVPAVGALLAIVAMAEWLLWLIPPPHRPFEYMIAGTGATAAVLGALFAALVARKNGYDLRLGASLHASLGASLSSPGGAVRHITRRIVRGSAPPS